MRVIGWVLVVAAAVQLLVAIVGYARSLRGAYYDAIAVSTLFDGRWLVGALLAGFGAMFAVPWPWYAPLLAGVAGFATALPVKMVIRFLVGR